jgi:hypothetical protein
MQQAAEPALRGVRVFAVRATEIRFPERTVQGPGAASWVRFPLKGRRLAAALSPQQERAGCRWRGGLYANRLLHVLIHIDGAVNHDQPHQRDRNKPYNQRHRASSLTLRFASWTAQGRRSKLDWRASNAMPSALQRGHFMSSPVRHSAKAEPGILVNGEVVRKWDRSGIGQVAAWVRCSKVVHRSTNHIAPRRGQCGIN